MCSNSSGWRKAVNSSRSAAKSPLISATLNLRSSRGSIFLKLNWSVASSNSSGLARRREEVESHEGVFFDINIKTLKSFWSEILTKVVTVSCLLIFIPWDLVVFVQVIVRPDLCNVLIDVTLLYSLDPGLEFISGNISINIAVNTINYFPRKFISAWNEKKKQQQKKRIKWNLQKINNRMDTRVTFLAFHFKHGGSIQFLWK